MILKPITMRVPNSSGIYAPSKIQASREISQQEFLNKFADYPRHILVSFELDGLSNPQRVTAYGRGLDCWWIL